MPESVIAHASFETLRRQPIEALNLEVQEFRHRKTGAIHYHMASDNTENVFLVALRTLPTDSTGVAHILEHTALCGSRRYPVRDPFFMMLRRSLNTFMNAFTSSDWTAYPFASQNRKDFGNLLDVYLDAVFFAQLDELDFAQEGHRVEFAEPDNPDSELLFKGVVFNEMKGAMSSVSSILWHSLCEQLFTRSTYHYNSGGDPEHIPDLSYDELKRFYSSHYHPSNAIFMTFGDMDAAEHQSVFEEQALQHFEPLSHRIAVEPDAPMTEPRRVERPYALDGEADTSKKTHIVMGWVLGTSTELEPLLEAQLLASVLLDNSAAPLMQLLETTALGQSPSPLCGLEDSMRDMVFCCGVEGSEAAHVDALENEVLDVIRQVAEQGVPLSQLEAVLHQLELHQREISGDSYPYGLQVILSALGPATHHADPIAVLNLEPVIEKLRQNIADPSYIRGLAQRLLLDNPHRVTLVLAPDTELSARRQAAEQARLAAIKQQLSDEQRQAIVQQAAALQQRQSQADDPGLLPSVGIEDVPASLPELTAEHDSCAGTPITRYAQGTNGLVYQQLVVALPSLSQQQLAALPLYSNALTEIGLGSASYLETQHRHAATVGSIQAFTSMRSAVDNAQQVDGYLVISSKALASNSAAQAELLRDTVQTVRWDEQDRLRDLVSQQRARREQSITGNGHGLAMTAACAGLSPLAALNHQLGGLAAIADIRQLDKSLAEPGAALEYCQHLSQLHQQLISGPRQYLAIAEAERLPQVSADMASALGALPAPTRAEPLSLPELREARREVWVTNTQVNFCATAFPTVSVGHADAAALTVLGGFLRNGFLHRAVREQGGAYGGGASQDSSVAAFRFYSYRDPRLGETLEDFQASVQWLQDSNHEARALEEAILGVIGSLDKPGSPAGEAKQHFHNGLFGRSHAQRQAFRQSVLGVSLDDLRRVAEAYLRPEQASVAVITNEDGRKLHAATIDALQLQLREL